MDQGTVNIVVSGNINMLPDNGVVNVLTNEQEMNVIDNENMLMSHTVMRPQDGRVNLTVLSQEQGLQVLRQDQGE